MSITVGRDRSCDIILENPRVSRFHARISIVNGSYLYEDTSTNGTLINGTLVKSRSVNVRPGDNILLASADALPWAKVQSCLPLNVNFGQTQSYNPQPVAANGNQGYGNQGHAAASFSSSSTTPPSLNKWSWGGFFFGWLWAVFNGIYWPLIVFIPFIGWIASIVISIILGINGNRMAWEKKTWQGVDHFEKAQKSWAKAALIVFLVSILSGVLIFVFAAASVGAAIASF